MKEKLEQIKYDVAQVLSALTKSIHAANEILDTVDLALQHFELTATRKANHILIEGVEGAGDIQFSIDGGKVHSVKEMRKKIKPPPPAIEGNTYKVGKPENLNKKWDIWAIFDGEKKHTALEAIEETPVEPKSIWYGIWDKDIKEFNHAGVVHPNDAESIIGEGRNCIVSLSHTFENIDIHNFTQEERNKWKAKIGGWKNTLAGLDVGVLVQDEPFAVRPQHPYKNFTVEEIEWLIDTVHEEIGIKAGISITRNDALTGALPQNADFLMPTMYVFLTEEAWEKGHVKITNRKEFDEYFDLIISRIRLKTDAELLVTMQGFHGGPWGTPPVESVQWTIEAVYRNDLKGITCWEMGKEDAEGTYKGLATMPELLEEIVRLNEKIPTNSPFFE